jgi:DNA uptake protein ComE-like DNA-binding protein
MLWEVRARAPMLPVRLFGTNHEFAIATGAAFLLFFATYGWFFLSFQFYVYALGFSPLGAAAGLIPNIVVTVPAALAGPRLANRYGWRSVVTFAFVVGAISFLFIAIAGQWLSFLPIAIGFALFGVALGLPQAPATEAIIEALPPSKQGIASAVNDASRELGAAFGIAIFGSLFNAGYRAGVAGYHGPAPPDVLETVKDSPALGAAVAEKLGPHGGPQLQQLVENSTADGWSTAFVAGAAFFALAAYFVWRHGPRFVHVPAGAPMHHRAPVPLSPADLALIPEGKYSLNHATFDELRSAGMTVTQAKRVIASREVDGAFSDIEELDLVPGISRASLAEFKEVFVVPLQPPEDELQSTASAEEPEPASTPSHA